MATRDSFADVQEAWGGEIKGYRLFGGQSVPETHQDLIAFMIDRLKIECDEPSLTVLTQWLINDRVNSGSCSPDTDTAHVEAVVLMGDLDNPDEYTAKLPAGPMSMLFIPPPEAVRKLIANQSTRPTRLTQ